MARLITAAVLAAMCSGCLWGNPGGEVRRGMTQQQRVGWSAEGNFTQEAEGTQTNNMLMAEGEIVMKEDDNGKPVIDFERSQLTAVLITSPSAQDASNALAQAFQASTAQAELFGKTLEGMIIPLMQARLEAQPAPGDPGESGGLTRDDVLEIIRSLRDGAPVDDGG